MKFILNTGEFFRKEEVIDLLVSLSGADANSEKQLKGFFNSLSKAELEAECDEYWKD